MKFFYFQKHKFRQWILDYPKDQMLVIAELLKSYSGTLYVFHSREEANNKTLHPAAGE